MYQQSAASALQDQKKQQATCSKEQRQKLREVESKRPAEGSPHIAAMAHMSMFALCGVTVRVWIREQRKIKRRSMAPLSL